MIASGPTLPTAGPWSPAPMSAAPASRSVERIRIGSGTPKEADWAATPRLFVAIGGVPNTDWAADTAIVRDTGGYLVTGPGLLASGARALLPGDRGPGLLRGRGCAPPLDQARCHRSWRRRDGHRLRSQIPGRNGMIPCTSNRASCGALLSWRV